MIRHARPIDQRLRETTMKHVLDLGYRAAEFSMQAIRDEEITAIPAVLAHWYGPGADPASLDPHDDEAGLRAALERVAPGLAALGHILRDRLEAECSGLLIPSLGMADRPLSARRGVLLALGLFIGSPTATDKIDRRMLWDIKVCTSGLVSTFSQHAYEADFHTDTQYYPNPERYLMLYCVRPAACGGGVSTFRDVRCIERGLSRTEAGRWALALLSSCELPFRIPAVFTKTGSPDTVEVTFARIFGSRPRIRFRTDTLRMGLQAFPASETPDIRRALALLQAELDDESSILKTVLPADSLLVVNNHEALHGRSAFTDPERHMLRLRITDGLPQDPARVVCPSVANPAAS